MRLINKLPASMSSSARRHRKIVRSSPGKSHLMSSQLGFLSEAGQDEPFDESSARILCGVNPALRNSEPFDELSARIFCAGVLPHNESS